MLELSNVTKQFGGLTAVDDLNLLVKSGEVLGLIGPNGSGKTTSFNVISGFHKPTKGRITFEGRDISGFKPSQICGAGIARTFQLTKPFGNMTALQNVMIGRMYGRASVVSVRKAAEKSEELLAFVGLEGRGAAEAHTFGVVDRKRLEIARALATEPKMLLLDEMMSGLTPTEIISAIDLVRKISQSGITLIVVEHVMKVIMDLSTRLIVLNYGKKIADGAPEDVMRNPEVIAAYLGD